MLKVCFVVYLTFSLDAESLFYSIIQSQWVCYYQIVQNAKTYKVESFQPYPDWSIFVEYRLDPPPTNHNKANERFFRIFSYRV